MAFTYRQVRVELLAALIGNILLWIDLIAAFRVLERGLL